MRVKKKNNARWKGSLSSDGTVLQDPTVSGRLAGEGAGRWGGGPG